MRGSPSLGLRTRSPDDGHLGSHDLRHGHATLSIAAGIDLKTVSTRLGHFSASFTPAQYAHALQELDEDAAIRIGDVLTRDVSRP